MSYSCGETVEWSDGRPWTKCGDSRAGVVQYCDECQAKNEEAYPQGWRYYAGDTCEHGKYVGGIAEDWMCPYCESGISMDELMKQRYAFNPYYQRVQLAILYTNVNKYELELYVQYNNKKSHTFTEITEETAQMLLEYFEEHEVWQNDSLPVHYWARRE